MDFWKSVWMTGAAWAVVLAAAPAVAETLTLSAEDCANVVEHVPAPDVAYKPGVDAYGNPVAPADLPGSPKIDLPKTFTFDVNIDMSTYLPGTQFGNLDMKVGTVRYDIDSGTLTFNGKPLTDPDAHALAEACAKAQREGK